MKSGERPPLDREAFVRHLARMSRWAEAMRAQLVAEGIAPATLPATEDEIPESGAALTITMLRAELRQAADLVQDAEQEIEQHEREIMVLKDQLNESQNEAMGLRKRLGAEAPLREVEEVAARQQEIKASLVQNREKFASRGKREPRIMVALRELGQATNRQLVEHLKSTRCAVQVALSGHRALIAKTRLSDGRTMVYRLATAAAPEEAIPVAPPSEAPPSEAPPAPTRGAFDDLGERIVRFLRERGSSAAPGFIAGQLKAEATDVEAAIVALAVGGAIERRDLGTIVQWKAKPARIDAA